MAPHPIFDQSTSSSSPDESGTKISTKAIGLIVGLGIVPLIIVMGVVIWLLVCYGNDRLCCPCGAKRKRKADARRKNRVVEKGSPDSIPSHRRSWQMLSDESTESNKRVFVDLGSVMKPT